MSVCGLPVVKVSISSHFAPCPPAQTGGRGRWPDGRAGRSRMVEEKLEAVSGDAAVGQPGVRADSRNRPPSDLLLSFPSSRYPTLPIPSGWIATETAAEPRRPPGRRRQASARPTRRAGGSRAGRWRTSDVHRRADQAVDAGRAASFSIRCVDLVLGADQEVGVDQLVGNRPRRPRHACRRGTGSAPRRRRRRSRNGASGRTRSKWQSWPTIGNVVLPSTPGSAVSVDLDPGSRSAT